MNDKRLPLSRRHLDIAIERLSGRFGEAQRIRRAVANTIVTQLMPDCVIKGGSSLKFRYGDIATRVTKDLDVAQGDDLATFIKRLDDALGLGWNGFTGHVVRREPATPKDASGFLRTVAASHGRHLSKDKRFGRTDIMRQSTICK